MKKTSLIIACIVTIICTALIGYEYVLPKVIAKSITDEPSPFIPQDMHDKIAVIRKPVNDGADAVIQTAHSSNVRLEDILKAIDEVEEKQAYNLLDELNSTKLHSEDQVFDLMKKHFPVRFDAEIFRKPFREKVSLPTIRKAIKYANYHRENQELDITTAKAIAKTILLEKEEEFNKLTRAQ